MGEHRAAEEIGVGTVIRTHKWRTEHTGTVMDRKGDTLAIAWHNSFVESELQVGEVEVWPDAPEAPTAMARRGWGMESWPSRARMVHRTPVGKPIELISAAFYRPCWPSILSSRRRLCAGRLDRTVTRHDGLSS